MRLVSRVQLKRVRSEANSRLSGFRRHGSRRRACAHKSKLGRFILRLLRRRLLRGRCYGLRRRRKFADNFFLRSSRVHVQYVEITLEFGVVALLRSDVNALGVQTQVTNSESSALTRPKQKASPARYQTSPGALKNGRMGKIY